MLFFFAQTCYDEGWKVAKGGGSRESLLERQVGCIA